MSTSESAGTYEDLRKIIKHTVLNFFLNKTNVVIIKINSLIQLLMRPASRPIVSTTERNPFVTRYAISHFIVSPFLLFYLSPRLFF